MQYWWIKYSEKHFDKISKVVFVMALLIIAGQIFEFGIINKSGLYDFAVAYKYINIIFGIMCTTWMTVLLGYSRSSQIKYARYIFLLLCMTYLVSCLIDLVAPNFLFLDFQLFRAILGTMVSFVAISYNISALGNSTIHPANLFVISFVFLILLGTFCLLLPAATTKPISFIQALFTSTSAVTVTGLAVLDTGKDLTIFGQVILLILIQLGGLGVLTVTNIFALIFKSSTTYRNRMMVTDMIKEINSNNTFSTLFKIVLITLIVEFIGALLIYISISNQNVASNPMFFSMFHAISAFCNAGFSPLSNGLYESTVKFNYSFQLIISWLIITGGLGYLIMISHYKKLKNWVLFNWSALSITEYKYERVLIKTSANARLVLVTTAILLIFGTVGFMMIEYNGVLKDHNFWGKIVVSFFNSVTPRTAGFNNVNMGDLRLPTVMLIMALMWIGASPASTGGGIKTTTFAVAVMNLYNQIRGKDRLIYNYKEIPSNSINQVSAVILLSIIAIGTGTLLLAYLNPDKLFRDLMFEVISAYSTVGLSLNLTMTLTDGSWYVLVVVMFLGRVSFLTFLIGIFGFFASDKPSGPEPYYPKDNVFIN